MEVEDDFSEGTEVVGPGGGGQENIDADECEQCPQCAAQKGQDHRLQDERSQNGNPGKAQCPHRGHFTGSRRDLSVHGVHGAKGGAYRHENAHEIGQELNRCRRRHLIGIEFLLSHCFHLDLLIPLDGCHETVPGGPVGSAEPDNGVPGATFPLGLHVMDIGPQFGIVG